MLWQKKYGGTKEDDIESIHQTYDGGYIIGASTASIDGTLSTLSTKGGFDYWIFKTDSAGNMQWQKRFGGSSSEFTKSLIITKDSCYLFVGHSTSTDSDFVGNHGMNDISVFKLNKQGNIVWKKILGGSKDDYGYALCETIDGNYLVGGSSQSINGDRTTPLAGGRDMWFVSLYPKTGNIKWEKVIGGKGEDEIRTIYPTKDKGYIVGSRLAYNNNDYIYNYHFDTSATTLNQWDDWAIYKLRPFIPTLTGNIYLDANNNSTKDASELYKANVKVQLSNGNYTFTDANGYYEIYTDSIGAYTLTITPPAGYNAVPATVSYNFSTWDTTVTKAIALQPTVVVDSVYINCIPMQMQAVQGNPMPYWLQYGNVGTTTASPTISLTYNNALLVYDSCTDATAAATASGLATGTNNMQPGSSKNLIGYFTVKSTATVGDTLRTVYGIATTTQSQNYSFDMLIESGTPSANAQRATPSLTTAQVAAGTAINYTIGFKNDGADTAYNVIITDTLSNLLQNGTVKMIL